MFWPTSKNEPFATFINQTPKYVVSTTLKQVEWAKSTLVKGSLKDAVRSLKQQAGKDIGVAGSVTLVQPLASGGSTGRTDAHGSPRDRRQRAAILS